ncbi:MAG: hypothetical protein OJF47_000885 [Nitrospira sp.]|nr:MAG: hypothetical protein OJF47_000885 [Nitrospira sp.]
MQARYSQRVPVECPIMFAGESAVGEGRMLDLSIPGCLLESPQKMSAGEYVQLRLFLPDLQMPVHVPLAAVRWVNDFRVGIEFIRTSRDEQRRLEQFVRRRLGHGEALAWSERIVVIGAMGS